MVLLSDGVNTAGSDSIAEAQKAAAKNIKIFTIGFGEADYELLQDIANITGGKYYYAADVTELQDIYTEVYEEIAAIAEQAQVKVKLPGVNVSGVVIPNATYVNNSVNITFTPEDEPSTDISSEPTTTSSSNNQILTFDIQETIRIGDKIKISYRLFVNGTGTIIAGDSTVEAGNYTQNFGPVTGPTIEGTGGGGFGNDPPVAVITAKNKVHVDKPIPFDGSGSYDPDPGEWIVNWTWDFGDGTPQSYGNLTSGDTAGTARIKATEQYSGAFKFVNVEIKSRGKITLE